MKGLVLNHNGNFYRFLKFDFEDHADGSLYIVFDRKPEDDKTFIWSSSEPQPVPVAGSNEKFRISYHTSGTVIFHGHPARSIYCEPTFAITQEHWLCCISVPSVKRLEAVSSPTHGDFVVDIGSDADGRRNFFVYMAPNGFRLHGSGVDIDYAGWFKIIVRSGPLDVSITDRLKEHFVTLVPTEGPFLSQILSMPNAVIAFHQKARGEAGDVAYFEPNEGVYRLIFSTEMRITPKIDIDFVDSTIQAEIISVKNYQLKFRAKGTGGYVKREALPVRSIIRDAEL